MRTKLLFVIMIVMLVLSACAKPAAKPTEPVEVIWYVRSNDAEQKWENEVVILRAHIQDDLDGFRRFRGWLRAGRKHEHDDH